MPKTLACFMPVVLMIGTKLPESILQKLLPGAVDPFASLALTYFVCVVYSLFFESTPKA